MCKTDAIIQYLMDAYRPDAIIVYGSFADGSAGAHSDFDALVIAGDARKHDASVVAGTVLDVFVYPAQMFRGDYDPEEFVQVYDGKILLDRSGLAKRLRRRVLEYIEKTPAKADGEIRQALDWCEKMLARTGRGDAEGFYRWHWLLVDSLEIYFDARGLRYFGPKKALRELQRRDAEGFALYSRALRELSRDALAGWIAWLRESAPARGEAR